MWKSKYLAGEVWAIWERELKRMLQSKLIEREWPKLRDEFESYPEFFKFVEDAQDERNRVLLKASANKPMQPTAIQP
jgi:hypothetical protein